MDPGWIVGTQTNRRKSLLKSIIHNNSLVVLNSGKLTTPISNSPQFNYMWSTVVCKCIHASDGILSKFQFSLLNFSHTRKWDEVKHDQRCHKYRLFVACAPSCTILIGISASWMQEGIQATKSLYFLASLMRSVNLTQGCQKFLASRPNLEVEVACGPNF